ncbi:MAG: transcriptional regulator [Gammaproteobacteria bacterium]|nr:MAG: transcriptional regulator [Gammaproteobacteria bacterium]
MHNAKIVFALLLACASLPATAQEPVDMGALNSAIETQRQVTEAQRQMIVSKNLELTEAESGDFWPLYRKYRSDVGTLDDRRLAIITEYAKKYETLDDRTAIGLLRDSLKLEADRIKLMQRHVSRFDKILPGTKVARFMQIEVRLNTITQLKVQSAIPLVM